MKHQKRVQHLDNVARQIAPSLRDKFDFSSDDQFTKWAELSWKAAEAFTVHGEKQMEDAGKKDVAEFEAAKAKADAEKKAKDDADKHKAEAVEAAIAAAKASTTPVKIEPEEME